MCERNRFYQII